MLEFQKLSSRWSEKSTHISNSTLVEKRVESSPKTVLDSCEGESLSTEEDSSSIGESSTTGSPPLPLSSNGQSHYRKQIKRISSFLRSPFTVSERKRNEAFPIKEKQQPLLRCFSYEEIANATNNFNPGILIMIKLMSS